LLGEIARGLFVWRVAADESKHRRIIGAAQIAQSGFGFRRCAARLENARPLRRAECGRGRRAGQFAHGSIGELRIRASASSIVHGSPVAATWLDMSFSFGNIRIGGERSGSRKTRKSIPDQPLLELRSNSTNGKESWWPVWTLC